MIQKDEYKCDVDMIKNRMLCILAATLMITTIFAFVPNIMAFNYSLEQTDNSTCLWYVDDVGFCIAQLFVPTEDFFIFEVQFSVEVYAGSSTLYGGVTSILSNDPGDWLGDIWKYDEILIDQNSDGWICYGVLDSVGLSAGQTYYIILKNAGNYFDSGCNGNYGNPYSSGSAFWCDSNNGWTNGDDEYNYPDFAFTISGYLNM